MTENQGRNNGLKNVGGLGLTRVSVPNICKERVGHRSTFIIRGRESEPITPDDLRASPPWPISR